jgi:hypothetical protein
MGLTALIVPMALKLPAWVEAEAVVAGWWLIWCVALTGFLYNGWLVTHDFETPTFSKPSLSKPRDERDSYNRGWWDGFFWGGFGVDDGEGVLGCLLLIALIILLPVILVFLVEAAVFVAFVMYLLVRGMLGQVTNSRLRCRGRLARSLGFAVFWSTLYTAPLAGLVWLVHRVHG